MNNTSVKPFVKWPGGKSNLLPELSRRMPTHFGNYYEPFLGGGALFFHLQPKRAVLSDRNVDLIRTYKVVRDNPEGLISNLLTHRYSQDYYYTIRNADKYESYLEWSDIKKASRFIYLNKTCFNGLYRVNKKGQFNVPMGSYKNPTICNTDVLRACSKVLKNIIVESLDYESIGQYVVSGDFVYFDPPYHPTTDGNNFTAYTPGGFTEEYQERLSLFCKSLCEKGVKFMLSNSNTPLILSLYEGFNIEIVNANRSISSNGSGRNQVRELIIRNY